MDSRWVCFHLAVMSYVVRERTVLYHTELWRFTFYIWIKEDRRDKKGKHNQNTHDCRRQLVLTGFNLEREGFEIFSDNDIWHNPESNKTFLRPPRRKVASGDLGIWGVFMNVFSKRVLHQVWMWVQKEDQPMELMCLIARKWAPQLNIFSAKPNILRFSYWKEHLSHYDIFFPISTWYILSYRYLRVSISTELLFKPHVYGTSNNYRRYPSSITIIESICT